jgi:Ca2+-dependent lipid-binding protein
VTEEEAANVTILLWDEDEMSKNDLVGSTTLSILPYKNNKTHVSAAVSDSNGEEQGKIEVDIEFQAEGEDSAAAETKSAERGPAEELQSEKLPEETPAEEVKEEEPAPAEEEKKEEELPKEEEAEKPAEGLM